MERKDLHQVIPRRVGENPAEVEDHLQQPMQNDYNFKSPNQFSAFSGPSIHGKPFKAGSVKPVLSCKPLLYTLKGQKV